MYSIYFTKNAIRDIPKLKSVGLDAKTKALIDILRNDPYQNSPPYEKLLGNLKGAYSRRINIKHRLVYEVIEDKKAIRIISMWSHYEF